MNNQSIQTGHRAVWAAIGNWKISVALLTSIAAFGQTGAGAPAFEVATIKPVDKGGVRLVQGMSLGDFAQTMSAAGFISRVERRISLKSRSLRSLIATANVTSINQIDGPDWMANTWFDIDAKIPDDAPVGDANKMLQSLLEERFGLRVHRERREQAGFALVTGKKGPMLKLSAPAIVIPDDMSPDDRQAKLMSMLQKPQPRVPTPGANSMSYSGYTMDKFAEILARLVDRPVTNMTGLTDRYDVDLNLSTTEREDTTILVIRALESLGLKLEARKVFVDLVVVDKASKVPVEN